jgi:hypothetical protein
MIYSCPLNAQEAIELRVLNIIKLKCLVHFRGITRFIAVLFLLVLLGKLEK